MEEEVLNRSKDWATAYGKPASHVILQLWRATTICLILFQFVIQGWKYSDALFHTFTVTVDLCGFSNEIKLFRFNVLPPSH
jgi:hypothetical protein